MLTSENYLVTAYNPPCEPIIRHSNVPSVAPNARHSHSRCRHRRCRSSPSSSDESRRHSPRPSKRRSSHYKRRHSSHRSHHRSQSSRWRSPSSSQWSDTSESPNRQARAHDRGQLSRAPSMTVSRGDPSSPRVSGEKYQTLIRAGVPPLPGVALPAITQARAGDPSSHRVAPPTSDSGLHRPSPKGATNRCPVSYIPMGHSSQSLMPLIRASVTPDTWQVYGDCRPSVWVVGHSYIDLAAKRAMNRPGGKNLGFKNVEVNWRGIRGLRWQQVFPEMVDISRTAMGPLVLVIHAGGNDLVKRSTVELLTVMKTDMERFTYLFPDTVLVWSEIVPRAVWHGAINAKAIERSRRKINARMAKFLRGTCGIVVRHHQLEGDNSTFLRSDGVHLTDIGQDILLSGIQHGVDQALKVMGGGRSPV
ncbi:uncharacterized protein ACNLHF_022280 [Anomaloglossus baeobatrachus]